MRVSSANGTASPTRSTDAALVEHHHPRELGQAPQEASQRRIGPLEVQMRGPAKREHQIDRPVAHHLIGDVELAALRVLGLGLQIRFLVTTLLGAERANRARCGEEVSAATSIAGPGVVTAQVIA